MQPMRKIYRDSPEGSPVFIIGACLEMMKSFYSEDADYRAARKAFFIRLSEGLEYDELCAYVEEQSRGRITFTDDAPGALLMAFITADYTYAQQTGLGDMDTLVSQIHASKE